MNTKESITKSILLDKQAWDLVVEKGIVNLSEYVSELILDDLTDTRFYKRQFARKITDIQRYSDVHKLGYKVGVESVST